VPGNNDFPHAIWWEHKPEEESFEYNPTAGLTAFILQFARPDSELYRRGCGLAVQAVTWFLEKGAFEEMHVTACFRQLYESICRGSRKKQANDVAEAQISEGGVNGVQEKLRSLLPDFEKLLFEQIRKNICTDPEKWNGYVAMPSVFVKTKEDRLFGEFRELLKRECEHILAAQQPDGAYPVPWEWYTDYQEFEIARVWWRSTILIEKMLVLKEFWES
ncbi:MAG: hypothetical protein K2N94_10765, partial [Lachnospiraceae bacterium]|nr:hypothetical protein [Lachnospiraceae bacterium]